MMEEYGCITLCGCHLNATRCKTCGYYSRTLWDMNLMPQSLIKFTSNRIQCSCEGQWLHRPTVGRHCNNTFWYSPRMQNWRCFRDINLTFARNYFVFVPAFWYVEPFLQRQPTSEVWEELFSLKNLPPGEIYTDSTGTDLTQFIINTLNKNSKDRVLMLKLEQEMTNLVWWTIF